MLQEMRALDFNMNINAPIIRHKACDVDRNSVKYLNAKLQM